MGKQANTTKQRTCRSCEQDFFMTAKELKKHAAVCERAKAAGILLPGIAKPTNQIILTEE